MARRVQRSVVGGTAPMHSVFGAGLGVLISNSNIIQFETLWDVGLPLLAFVLLLFVAIIADSIYSAAGGGTLKIVVRLGVAAVAAMSLLFLFQRNSGACNSTAMGANSFAFCVDPDANVLFMSALMLLWCLCAYFLGKVRDYLK